MMTGPISSFNLIFYFLMKAGTFPIDLNLNSFILRISQSPTFSLISVI